MGEEQGEFCLQEDLEPVTTPENANYFLWRGKWEVFLTCLGQAILPVHIVWIKLEPNCLSDLYSQIKRILVSLSFVWLYEQNVPVVFFYPSLDGLTNLSDVHMATLTGDTVRTWSL